jgi:hypothetical protein
MAINPPASTERLRRRGWRPDEIADSFLLESERVILNEHQSVRAFLLGELPVAVVASVLIVAVSAVVPELAWLGVIGWVVLIAFLSGRALDASFTRYVLTDMRVLRVSGMLNRTVEFIPWAKVTDVSRRETFMQWLVGSATIRIESANERSAFREMTDVHRPDRFYDRLVRLVDGFQARPDLASLDRASLDQGRTVIRRRRG